jgi:hypothetical protein
MLSPLPGEFVWMDRRKWNIPASLLSAHDVERSK